MVPRLLLVSLLALAAPLHAATTVVVSDLQPTSNVVRTGGSFDAYGDSAVISSTDLLNALALGPVTIRNSSSGAAPGDVLIDGDVIWTSAWPLAVEAHRHIFVGRMINLFGASVHLHADATGTGTGSVFTTGMMQVSPGPVEVFYNPISYTMPESFVMSGGATATAYMLVNSRTNLQALTTNLAGSYALGRDIDAAGLPFTPIGTTATPFTGRLHGHGHVIRNLVVDGPLDDNRGLFGTISGGLVRDAGVTGASINGQASCGILAGSITNGTITRSFTTGTVSGTDNVGGLAGNASNSTISECWSTAFVNGVNFVGGLAGTLALSTAADAYATGAVSGSGIGAGGFAGGIPNATLVNVYAAGLVSGASNAGGLAGSGTASSVTNSYWDTQTSGQPTSVAGTGLTTAQMKQKANFSGWNFSNVWWIVGGSTYPYLRVASSFPSIADLVIGSAPTSNVTLTNGVFQATSSPATLDVADLASALASGNVIVRGIANGTASITAPLTWGAPTRLRVESDRDVILASSIRGGSKTQLRSNFATIAGSGGVDSPSVDFFYNPPSYPDETSFTLNASAAALHAYMLVHDQADLQQVQTNLFGTYALANDITLSGTFTPIGPSSATAFMGAFSGDFRTIRGLSSDRGLFGVINTGTVKDLRIEGAAISGTGNAGVLAATLKSGVVERVVTSGSVTTSGSGAGGLIGAIEEAGITQCASSATVTSTGAGQQGFGGLVGNANPPAWSAVTITDSYATGAVNGGTSNDVGGFAGFNNNTSTVMRCFSSGAVTSTGSNAGGFAGFNNGGPMTSNYWNIVTSGLATSAGATGKTTAQLMQQTTFAGWDFANVWNIFAGLHAPFLRIEDVSFVAAPLSVVAGTELSYTFGTAVSTQTYENGVPVAFTHTVPAGTSLVSSTLPASLHVAPGFSSTYGVTVAVPSSATGTLTVSGNVPGPVSTSVNILTVSSVSISAIASSVVAGQPVSWTVTLSNAGPSDSGSVTLVPSVPPSVTAVTCSSGCTASAVPGGGSVVFTVSGVLSPAATGTLAATFTAGSATTTVNTPITITSALGISAVASAAEAGLPMTWAVTVTNAGPSDAASVVVDPVLPAGVTFVSCSSSCTAPLIAGGSATFTITGNVASSVTGDITATFNAGTATTTVTSPVTSNASLVLTNSVATSGVAGSPVTWTITVTNNGPADASGVTVGYTSPPEVTGLSCSSGCVASTIATGSNAVFTISGTIAPSTISGTVVSLTATAASSSASASFNVTTATGLSIVFAGVPSNVTAGTTIPFAVQVSNAGPSDATNVTVTPSGWTCVTPCSFATIPAGTTVTIDGSVTVDPAATGTLSLSASAGAVNASASATITRSFALSIVVNDSPDPAVPGGMITFLVTVTNAGPSVADPVPFVVTLPTAWTLVSSDAPSTIAPPPGTFTYTIVAAAAATPGRGTTTVTVGSASASATTTLAAAAPVAVPTLTTWMLLALIAALGVVGRMRAS